MVSVHACPDCGADLTDGYCPDCGVSWSWAALAADDPPDYQHPEDDPHDYAHSRHPEEMDGPDG